MTTAVFKAKVPEYRARVETKMAAFMSDCVAPGTRLEEAVRYAVGTEGKRIRPLLAYATAELLEFDPAITDYPAAAVELIHTYSLVHDDLPAMDDDDLRRGRPTVHCAFDEATGVLVGDALLTHGFEMLATAPVDDRVISAWVRQLAGKAGAAGMIQGQSTDHEGETRAMVLEELETMHRRKTGGLIEVSMTMVASAANAATVEQQLAAFAHHLGLAFQIRDDILDVEGSTEKLGKPSGSDLELNKSTFVSLLGIDAARRRMQQEYDAAVAVLAEFGPGAAGLEWLASYIVNRDY